MKRSTQLETASPGARGQPACLAAPAGSVERHFHLVTFVAYKIGVPFRLTRKLAAHLRAGCLICQEEFAFIERLIEANARERGSPGAGP